VLTSETEIVLKLQNYIFQESALAGGSQTIVEPYCCSEDKTFRFTNEFWTARQRQASSIHEISYRACFKPQLPRFFIELLTKPEAIVYDPFSGRGTTALETALLGRKVIANDINPLSKILCEPRLALAEPAEIETRLKQVINRRAETGSIDLSMFYHAETEAELLSLRRYLAEQRKNQMEDNTDRWIRMIATNRLTGHSKGFFSVYTMPPNQAVSAVSQEKINIKRNQKPEYRDIKAIISKKSRQLMGKLGVKEIAALKNASKEALFLEVDAAHTAAIKPDSIDLTVTSPPFLDVVQYSKDNWLRCWFNAIDLKTVESKITMASTLHEWSTFMGAVLQELYRITKPGGWVAFEVGEVRKGSIKLDDSIIPLGKACGFLCPGVVINRQQFTKTANIWGIKNNCAGTNSNRIVLFHKK
jgi:adenine-specific DNA methylase